MGEFSFNFLVLQTALTKDPSCQLEVKCSMFSVKYLFHVASTYLFELRHLTYLKCKVLALNRVELPRIT